jgi:hypothetical protein
MLKTGLLVAWPVVHLSITAVMSSSAWAQASPGSGTPGQQNVSRADTLQDFEQQLGPFELNGERFTVILRKKLVRGGTDHDTQETLARLEIRDARGAVHYERSFPYKVDGNQFEETIDASVETLRGTQGTGLLVTYGELPSTPLGGESWQVFGIFNEKLVAFSKSIITDGQLITESPGEVRTSKEPDFQPDVLRLRVWSGNFFVIVPLRVDWLLAKMSLAWRCSKMTPAGLRSICEYGVEASRIPSQVDPTFVRLFPEAMEGITPVHVVVRKDSKIEFLATEAEVKWSENSDSVDITIADDAWLKVRIDGREGWIHTEEDFQAIGLPQAG